MQPASLASVSGGNAMGLPVTWQLERLGGETFRVSAEFARAAYLRFWGGRDYLLVGVCAFFFFSISRSGKEVIWGGRMGRGANSDPHRNLRVAGRVVECVVSSLDTSGSIYSL